MRKEEMWEKSVGSKKVISRPITVIKRVMVEVKLDKELRRINRHRTKILGASLWWYEVKNRKHMKHERAVCQLRQDGTINWEFGKCPIEVQEAAISLFPEEMLVSYITQLK